MPQRSGRGSALTPTWLLFPFRVHSIFFSVGALQVI